MKRTHFIQLTLLLALILFSMPAATTAAAPYQQTNLLSNPGFEAPYNNDGSAGSWVRWDRVSSADKFEDCANGYHKTPRWGMATDVVHGGSASQYVGNNWDTWAGGVWQTVSVTPGTTYRFTFYGYGYGAMNSGDPSYSSLNMNMRAAIDPNGSGVWSDSDVVWGTASSPHDHWAQFAVEATATGDKMTVFVAADWGVPGVNQCYKFLNTYFDDASLVEVGPPPTNTPPPQPTSPPPPPATATSAPANTAVPTEAPPPTEAAVSTEEPVSTDISSPTPTGATICVNAFSDDDANGVHDASEGYMAGVTFTVASNGQVLSQVISTGFADPICLEGLATGSYQIAQIVPVRLEMTTAANATLEITETAKKHGVEFGSRLRMDDGASGETVASAPDTTAPETGTGAEPTAPEEDEGVGLVAISGLVVMGLAIVMLGILIFVVLKRQ